MENYIVRIYRRDSDDLERIHGVLESVEQDIQRPFASLDSLKNMLTTTPEALKGGVAPSDNNVQPTLAK